MKFDDLRANLSSWPDDAPSRLDIDRLHAGQLEGPDADALKRRIEASPEAAAYLAERQRGLDDVPFDPRTSLAAIRRGVSDAREARDRWGWVRRLLPLLAAGAVGAAAVLLFVVPDDPRPVDTVRAKGALRLQVLRKTPTGAELVLSGDPFAPGDVLQFRVDLPAAGRVTVVGVESSGALYTAWPPPGAAPATRFDTGDDIDLPGAVALDDQPGTERLYLVLCPEGVEPRCASTGAETSPRCGADCQTAPFVLRKVAP